MNKQQRLRIIKKLYKTKQIWPRAYNRLLANLEMDHG